MFTTAAYKCCFCCISLLFVSCPFPSIFLGNFVIMTKCRYICRLAVFICFTIKFYTCFISNFSWFCTTCTFWLFFYFSLNSLHMIFISIICTCKGCCRTLVIICPIPHRITIFMAQFIKFYFFLACKSTDCCTSICILHFYSCNPDLYSVLFTSCCFALWIVFRNYWRSNLFSFWLISANVTFYICYSDIILAICIFFIRPFKCSSISMLSFFTWNSCCCCVFHTSICLASFGINGCCSIFIFTTPNSCCLFRINIYGCFCI